MIPALLIILPAGLSVFFVPGGPIADDRISFSRLHPGQEIRIDLQSTGCFHRTHHFLVFPADLPPQLDVYEYREEGTARKVGIIDLTADQVVRLDNLLRFYRRTDRPESCTTGTEVVFKLVERGKELLREAYSDESCRASVLDADPRDLVALGIDDPPVLDIERVTWVIWDALRHDPNAVPVRVALPSSRENSGARLQVQMQRDKARSGPMARELAGYADVEREFTIENADIGSYSAADRSLSVLLRSKGPRPVDMVRWYDLLTGETPSRSWSGFLATLAAIETRVGAHPWLLEWRKAEPKRSIGAVIVGELPHSNDVSQSPDSASPAWKHAGLEGRPFYALTLRCGSRWFASIWLGDGEDKALITHVNSGVCSGGGHWLDDMAVSYHTTQEVPDYIVVSPDGAWRLNGRARDEAP